MFKMTFVFTLCLCLASATVWGAIQGEEFTIGLTNQIDIVGAGAANSSAFISIDNSQLLDDLSQNQDVTFSGLGSVMGECMTVGLTQSLLGAGAQMQNTETNTTQTQNLSLAGAQNLLKTDGCGMGTGMLFSEMSQDQSIDGSVIETSSKLGNVFGNVIGPAGTTELVFGTLSSMSSQMQIVY